MQMSCVPTAIVPLINVVFSVVLGDPEKCPVNIADGGATNPRLSKMYPEFSSGAVRWAWTDVAAKTNSATNRFASPDQTVISAPAKSDPLGAILPPFFAISQIVREFR
jgi:hypothetical protein